MLEAAHRNSRSLYRETRRIGFVDGDLHARLDAPLYVTMPVWSRSTIALAYATALLTDRRFADAVDVLEDPVVTGDAMAAQWAQFVGAAANHLAHRWPDVLRITAKSPPAHATHVVDDLTAAVDTLAAAAAASIGQFQTALDRANTVTTKNQNIAADAGADQGMVSSRAWSGGGRAGIVRAGDQQRCAARRRFGGTVKPWLPIDRHRLGRPSPPAPTRGIPAPRRRGRSARPRRWRSRRTRCSRRRSASWTN